jgi:hypothetical protein
MGEGEMCGNMKYIEDHLVPYSCFKILVELSTESFPVSVCVLFLALSP